MHHARIVNETYRKVLGVVEQCRILSLIAQEFYPGYGARSNQLFDVATPPLLFKDVFLFWPVMVTTRTAFSPFRPDMWRVLVMNLSALRTDLSHWPAKTLEALDERVSLPHLPEEQRRAPFLIQIEKVTKHAAHVQDLVRDLYQPTLQDHLNIGQAILKEALEDRSSFLADEESVKIVEQTARMIVQDATFWKRVALLEAVKNGSSDAVASADLLLSPWNDYAPILSDRKLYLGPQDPGMSLPQTRFQQMDALAVWNRQVSLYEDILALRDHAVNEAHMKLHRLEPFEGSFGMVLAVQEDAGSVSGFFDRMIETYRSAGPRKAKKLGPLFKVADHLHLRAAWQSSAIMRVLASSYSHEVATQNLTRLPNEPVLVEDDYDEAKITAHIALMIARQKGLIPREATFDDAEIILKVRQIRDSLPSPDLSNSGDRYRALLASVS